MWPELKELLLLKLTHPNPSTSFYLTLALGLAVLFSIAALLSRTPFTLEKIVLNFAVGLSFGFLLPRLMGS